MQQLKVEQQNLKNCLEKQPSTRSILEPLFELLCKADRDKVNELEKKLEDQKKIVDISGVCSTGIKHVGMSEATNEFI